MFEVWPHVVSRWYRLVLLVCAIAVVHPANLLANTQSGGALAGSVLDPQGKAVADAALLVRRESNGEVRTATTDASGHFSVTGLPVGTYTVEVAVPGFANVNRTGIVVGEGRTEEIAFKLTVANIAEEVTVSAALPAAAVAAASQGSLTARSAQSLISNEYIRNYTSPISDYSQVLLMAPGTYSVAANGPGLGDTKTFYRGFKDGFYNMSFDGIPFGDTNDPTHHSWVFFPAQTIGSAVFDRSPGSAASIGPSTYGGSVNLLSQSLPSQQWINGSFSYGSFNTRLFDVEFDSGRLGDSGKSRFLIDAHDMRSDGYQTYNFQTRDAFSAKYQYAVSDHTMITAFGSVVDLHSNTPNQKGATRLQIQQSGDNFLNSGDPNNPLYYKFNFYHVPTHFEYIGFKSDFGNGWSVDTKTYGMRYHNRQNFNTGTVSTTSGTDKLNAYWKVGNILPVQYVSNFGVFRTGLWSEYASTNRYQTPSDPRTWIDAALPNFHESFITTTLQPYAEYEVRAMERLRITPGLKLAYYKQDFTQFADNGKTVGNLNGAPFVKHAAEYHSWLPSIDAHYLLQSYWSVYAQYGKGQNIPPTSYFDVKNALVPILPKPLLTDTYQVGSVWKSRRATLDVDVYYIKFQNGYTSVLDVASGSTFYTLTGTSVTKGFEAESTILVGGGLAVYLNGTTGSAKYSPSDLWVANTPKDTETIGLTFNRGSWNVGFFNKRVGQQWNDNGSNIHQAVATDPFNITNLFINYQLRGTSKFSRSRIRLAINNLTDSHAITAISPASTRSNVPALGDVLTLMAGRSVSVGMTVGFSPRNP